MDRGREAELLKLHTDLCLAESNKWWQVCAQDDMAGEDGPLSAEVLQKLGRVDPDEVRERCNRLLDKNSIFHRFNDKIRMYAGQIMCLLSFNYHLNSEYYAKNLITNRATRLMGPVNRNLDIHMSPTAGVGISSSPHIKLNVAVGDIKFIIDNYFATITTSRGPK